MPKRRSLFLITHTHWDREWYFPLEQYRFRLVRLFDSLLEILARQPGYHSYWLDGQAIPVEDYLAVRPEKRDALMSAIRRKKILIGPFYVSADEFLVAGEACIRNLLIGTRQMRAAGQNNLFGYLADIFGHVSQMPQILRGFGIDNAFFWRGYTEQSIKGSAEQIWAGADGSRIIAICLVRGYSSAARIYRIMEKTDGKSVQWPKELEEKGQFMDKLKDLRRFCKAGPILMMNGIDHALPLPNLPQVIKRLEEIQPDLDVRHASLAEYLKIIRGKKLPASLPRGELRFVPGLDSTASARVDQKIANARVEDLLIHYAEPLSAAASVSSREIPPGFLHRAWELVVKNHAHDTLCGCHADSVTQDLNTRFRRAEQIGRGIMREAIERLSGEIAAEEKVMDNSYLWIYQPCGWERKGPFEIDLELPVTDKISEISLVREGKQYPAQIISIKQQLRARYEKYMIPSYNEQVLSVHLLADIGGLASTSLSTCRIQVHTGRNYMSGTGNKLSPAWGILENGIIRAAIHKDGTVDILDLRTGLRAKKLNLLLDEPDGGNLYCFQKNLTGGDIRNVALPGRIKNLENGPLRAAYQVKTSIMSGNILLPLTIKISLSRGEDYVRIHTEIDNRARDHRLSAGFRLPKGFNRMWAHTPFDVVERGIYLPQYRTYFRNKANLQSERGWLMRPMQSCVAAVGRRGTLFVLNKGLYEYFQPQKDRLNVTLMRACGLITHAFTMYDSSGGQCLGKIALDYAVGLCGRTTPALLLKKAMEFRLPPHAYQTYPGSALEIAIKAQSICAVSRDDWIISAIKRSEDGKGIIVRVFSLSSRTKTGTITMGLPVRRAFLARLDEKRLQELKVSNQAVRLRLGPRRIATVFFAI
jgi:alpha-mannosidase